VYVAERKLWLTLDCLLRRSSRKARKGKYGLMATKTSTPRLARSLGLWAIVGLGLGYMTPTTVFDTFGGVAQESAGLVPLAYIVALVVMLFTAISYGRMTRVFPSAGSAYTYASETIHPNVGFAIGWSSLLDYLLLPMVNALIGKNYFQSFFPDAPVWIFVVVYVALITALNFWSMKGTSNINMVLVVFQTVAILTFCVLAWVQLQNGLGNGTPWTIKPLWHNPVEFNNILTAATIVCFSFIGFDAITMYSEEAKSPNTVPKAIVLALLIGGAIFFLGAWFAQSAFPNYLDLVPFGKQYDPNFTADTLISDSSLPPMAFAVGGTWFKIFFTAASMGAMVASSLSSHASVSRMIYVMGRNGKGVISRFLSFIHPKFFTPTNAVVLVGVVSLLAIPMTLDQAYSLINFGALIAFTFVNLTVIVFFAMRRKEVSGFGQIFRNIVLPGIGVVGTVLLWINLSADALLMGILWLDLGVILLIWLTRGFRQPLTMRMEEETLAEEGTPVPHVEHEHAHRVPALSRPERGATLGEAITRYWKKGFTFSGRASLSEFWKGYVASVGVAAILAIQGVVLITNAEAAGIPAFVGVGIAFYVISILLFLVALVPTLAAVWRRLHDTNLPGPVYFIAFIPVLGGIALLVLLARGHRDEGARFDVTAPELADAR
jgi:putrescine importer